MVLLEDDKEFWSDRIREHMLFIWLYMHAIDVKRQALKLYKEWEPHRLLSDLQVLVLMGDTLEFQNTIHARLLNREWLGSFFPAWMQHITDELDYARLKVMGEDLSDEQEILFWADLIKDHGALDARMIDPSEKPLIEEATAISDGAAELSPEIQFFMELTQDYMDDIIMFHEGAEETRPKTIIHHKLLTHVLEEERRGKYILQIIKDRSR
jgi:hypothetical protein